MLRSWVVSLVGEPAFERLATELSGSELQSVLLDVMHRRAAARRVPDVLAQWERDAFCRPSPIDLETSLALDMHLVQAASSQGFEPIELSPVTPLATCTSVALTDQNRIVSALRTTEIVSDPTNVLALECALRLRAAPSKSIHFATSQRVIRAQPIPKVPGFTQHFRIFVLASGGPETRDHAFTVETFVHHAKTMLAALDRLELHGYRFGSRRIDVRATAARASLGDRIAESLGPIARRESLEHAYYTGGLRAMIWVTAPDGAEVPLVDVGAFDWLVKLASNRRAVFVASGAGQQLMALRFRS